jgi:cytochrome c biogenesis protein CcdA
MTSLSEVYEGGVRTVVDRRRRALAIVLFAVGVTMGAVAILLTTTGVRSWVGQDVVEARRVAGVLAGLGLPAAMLGVFAALPANDETRAAAAIGASVSVFGMLLFVYAYPDQWLANEPALAVATVAVYALGVLVTFWCLFVAVATFNRRNDPGGTARVEITDEGKIRLVSRESETTASESDAPSVPGLGGIGFVGRDPDGDIPTQTNVDADTGDTEGPGSRDSRDSGTESVATTPAATSQTTESGSGADPARESSSGPGPGPEPTSDGGQSVAEGAGAEVISDARGQPDAYCGNCAYFEYVEVAGDLDPYCRYHQEFMDDLEACEQWTANTTDE